MNQKKCRRIASNLIRLEDNSTRTLSVVEIQQNEVAACYPLTQELPHTEWLPGCVTLRRDDKGQLVMEHNGKVINN